MKKILSVLTVSGFIFAGGSCLAADGSAGSPLYLKVLSSYVMPSDPEFAGLEIESDNGFGFGGAVGLQFNQARVEAEFAYQKTDIDAFTSSSMTDGYGAGIDSGDTKILSYMINGYYEFPVAEGFGIYVTAGLGMATTEFNIQDADDHDTTFAYKGGAGVSYAFDSHMAIDLGYEYLGVEDAEINRVEVSEINSNKIVGAFRYRF
ncbi:MAG: outer membrane beta-barrel protein [Proteobacteria bacterium]|nr:outer membrane beta-barrel protein [Pseudomonadota bacterium]MBU1419076.1 outer membrane beta-barrel protein [Pseudomonadota bacterium]MBU1453945.1 outer membrane beta-barrel protein [Pseudomonadota bacterium]